MKEISFENSQNTTGGGFCTAVAIADGVLAVGGAAAYFKLIAVTNPGILVGATLVLAGASIYCALK